ncbi:MAG: DUF1778 domain-containing protein [Burkholderiaceae bacterium]|nr:DUF1778 domain-containing protein [Burkholderiaceae bacterium]
MPTPISGLHAIKQPEVILLSPEDQKLFVQALLSPPERSPALQRAFARRQDFERYLQAIPNVPDKADKC